MSALTEAQQAAALDAKVELWTLDGASYPFPARAGMTRTLRRCGCRQMPDGPIETEKSKGPISRAARLVTAFRRTRVIGHHDRHHAAPTQPCRSGQDGPLASLSRDSSLPRSVSS